MEHFWQNVEGYLDHFELYDLAVSKYDKGTFVEIGTFAGRSSAYLGTEIHNSGKEIKLYTVDHFSISADSSANSTNFYERVAETLKPLQHCVSVIRGKSVEVSKQFTDNSVDFVYIDASHDYKSVKEDIEAWLPKVKVGGIVGGDDYQWEGVNKAVQELIPDAKAIGVGDNNWFWVKE